MSGIFANPVTLWIVIGVAVVLALGALLILALSAAGRLSPALRKEL